MGVCRDISECEIDFVKEMAEGLGCTGLLLDSLLEKANLTKSKAEKILEEYQAEPSVASSILIDNLNTHITEYNSLVDKAEDTLRWLLIQREACGFRTHKNVNVHYPIPPKLKPVKK
ncbi:MAG: hypothetical protein M0T73_00790 [Deltaproteobacteria bacterium]|nr:hypothetical protein [Deltaproteobacteria bacterium]